MRKYDRVERHGDRVRDCVPQQRPPALRVEGRQQRHQPAHEPRREPQGEGEGGDRGEEEQAETGICHDERDDDRHDQRLAQQLGDRDPAEAQLALQRHTEQQLQRPQKEREAGGGRAHDEHRVVARDERERDADQDPGERQHEPDPDQVAHHDPPVIAGSRGVLAERDRRQPGLREARDHGDQRGDRGEAAVVLDAEVADHERRRCRREQHAGCVASGAHGAAAGGLRASRGGVEDVAAHGAGTAWRHQAILAAAPARASGRHAGRPRRAGARRPL